MADVAITVENLGKQYVLPARQERYRTLRETLTRRGIETVRAVTSFGRQTMVPTVEPFWALRAVSFSVGAGEIIGIIGDNGSGKSTLLKILSRVTAPTTGRAVLYGRIGSLLEVGTGFHPELSGRENIMLNGAILGMRRVEIQRKFDAILAFAEIDRFIDTPVKHYSSGMYLRLAFAVAAHLEPEILIIDEVLAVGDAAFQKKCMGRIGDVAQAGRTVLFVSHNMAAVRSLCDRAIWLRNGGVEKIGATAPVVSEYLRQATLVERERFWPDRLTAPGNQWIRLHRGRIRRATEDGSGELSVRTPFVIEIEHWKLDSDKPLTLSINLYNEEGVLVFSVGPSQEQGFGLLPTPAGLFREECHVPGDFLNDGLHRSELYVMRGGDIIYHDPDFLSFLVADSAELRGDWFGKWPGAVRPRLRWTIELLRPFA